MVSSPLARALDTARPIADRQSLPVDTVADLVDRDWGPWTEWAEEDVTKRFGSIDEPPGAERLETFCTRVVTALQRIVAADSGGDLLVVAHDAVNWTLPASLVPSLGRPSDIPQMTGCWNHLARAGPGWVVKTINARPGDGRRPVSRSS